MNKSLIKQPQQGSITLDPNYLDNAQDWEDFVSLWMISKEIDVRNQWFKGDIANRVAIAHGEGSLKKFGQEVGESPKTIGHFRRVSRAFRGAERNLNVSWTHYLIASFADSYKKGDKKFDGDTRKTWVEKAHDEGWSTAKLTAEIKKAGAIANKQSVYDYYDGYFDKLRNILLHIEKDSLSDEEKKKLMDKLMGILVEFKDYLKS